MWIQSVAALECWSSEVYPFQRALDIITVHTHLEKPLNGLQTADATT